MKAVIMAGGEGTRLRPLTSNTPKPMLPLANRPMMEHVVTLLRRHGFSDVVVTLAFLPAAIRTYFGDGSEFGVRIAYAVEEQPLGTAGSVRNAMDALDEPFLVISGDILTDIDLGAIAKFHEERRALATVGLTSVENPVEFGVVITRPDGAVERFLEKPTWGQVFSDTVNAGVFVLEPDIFDHIEPGRSVDFSSEVFPRLLAERRPIYGAVVDGYWEDVGTLDAYLRAHQDVLDGKVAIDVAGFKVQEGVWLGEGAELDPAAVVEGPAIIGPDSRVEAGVRLGPYTVLGSNVRVRRDGDIERSVVHDNAYLAEGVALRGTVVGRSCDIRGRARCDEGSVIGDECFIGEGAQIGAGVKVYSFKTVEAGALVHSSLVWESRGARRLFGRTGVTGLANVDITPELAAKLAMAYGSTLKKGTTVVTSRDSSRSARMLKRALMSGLNASGIDVIDLEIAPMPVTRHLVRSPRAQGGLSVRLVPGDTQSVTVRFLDASGADIGEDAQRKIERLYQLGDLRHVLPNEIGDINFPPRALEDYTAELRDIVEPDAIAAAGFKVVIDYSYGSTSVVMPNVFSSLRAEVLAVNPYASTVGLIAFDRGAAAEHVARLVKASGAHLGAVLDPDGERIVLIDDEGRVLSDAQTLMAAVRLVSSFLLGDRIALPVNVTSHAERIAREAGIQVRPTKLSVAALMDAANEPGVGFAASGDGGFILPGFLPAFDAAAMLVKVLDLLARTGLRLSEVVDALPRVTMVHETLVTPWEHKGLVMRSLVEGAQGERLVLVDGVKVLHEHGWVLALPDPEEPVTHVWAEAGSDTEARRLAQDYGRRIRQVLRER